MGYIPYQQPISKSVNLDIRVNRQLESRMREIRQSGSEGGGAQPNALSLPLSLGTCGRRPLHCRSAAVVGAAVRRWMKRA